MPGCPLSQLAICAAALCTEGIVLRLCTRRQLMMLNGLPLILSGDCSPCCQAGLCGRWVCNRLLAGWPQGHLKVLLVWQLPYISVASCSNLLALHLQVLLGQVLHQVDELLPASSLPFDDIAAAALLLVFGLKTLQAGAASHMQAALVHAGALCVLLTSAFPMALSVRACLSILCAAAALTSEFIAAGCGECR